MSSPSFPPRSLTTSFRPQVAIVASRYNDAFVGGLIAAARDELKQLMPQATVTISRVPGAFEIPVCVHYLANNGDPDVIIALGVIIRGETEHADLVARSVFDSLQRIASENIVPVINEVLLVNSSEQAHERCLGSQINRGTEAARAAAGMVQLFQNLKNTRTAPASPNG